MANQQSDEKRLTIGVMVGELNPYTDLIWSGISERANEKDINLIVLGGKKLVRVEEKKYSYNIIYQLAKGKSFDGIILLASEIGQFTTLEELEAFCSQFSHLPVVSIGEEIKDVSSIIVDNREGLHDLICHLIDAHNSRRLAFLQGPPNNQEAQARFETYKQTLKEREIPFDPELIVQGGFHYTPL